MKSGVIPPPTGLPGVGRERAQLASGSAHIGSLFFLHCSQDQSGVSLANPGNALSHASRTQRAYCEAAGY